MYANKRKLKETTDLLLDKVIEAAEKDLIQEYTLENILKISMQYSKIIPEMVKISDDIENIEQINADRIKFIGQIMDNPKAAKLLNQLSELIY